MADHCNGQCTEKGEDISSISSTKNEPIKGGYESLFIVPKMDCPSEERMIRMALDHLKPQIGLEFDTPNRRIKSFMMII